MTHAASAFLTIEPRKVLEQVHTTHTVEHKQPYGVKPLSVCNESYMTIMVLGSKVILEKHAYPYYVAYVSV